MRNNKSTYMFATLIAIIVAGVIVYFYRQQAGNSIPTPPTTPSLAQDLTSTSRLVPDPRLNKFEVLSFPNNTLDTSDWQIYRNEQLGLELRHPRDWEIVWDGNIVNGGNNYFGVLTLLPPNAVFDGPMIVNISVYKSSLESTVRELSQRGWYIKKSIKVNNLYGVIIDTKNPENTWGNKDSYYLEHGSLVFSFQSRDQKEITQKILLSFRPIK